MAGAILVGTLPTAKNLSSNETTDLCHWNMNTFRDVLSERHIWVSRISSSYADVAVEQITNALDANHNYRTGASRLPHTAYYLMHAYPEMESAYYPRDGEIGSI